MARKQRITPKIKNGLTNKQAPFWKGDTADGVLQRRVEARAKVRAEKKSKRKQSKADTSTRELRRLERNLKKRKTAEARRRIAARSKELRRAT